MMYCIYIIKFCTLSHTYICAGTPTQERKVSDNMVERSRWWGRLIYDRTIRSDGDGFDLCASSYLWGTTHVIIILPGILFLQLHTLIPREIELSPAMVEKFWGRGEREWKSLTTEWGFTCFEKAWRLCVTVTLLTDSVSLWIYLLFRHKLEPGRLTSAMSFVVEIWNLILEKSMSLPGEVIAKYYIIRVILEFYK